jgi:hypothetical protein
MTKNIRRVSAIIGTPGEGVCLKKDKRVIIGGKPMSRYGAKRRGYDPSSAPGISLQASGPLKFAKTGS